MINIKDEQLDGYLQVGVTRVFNDTVMNAFGKEIEELEKKITNKILDSIKLFPKAKKGYIKNRLEVKIILELRLKVQHKPIPE